MMNPMRSIDPTAAARRIERAVPNEGFPPAGELLWEIGLLLAALLGLALAASAALVG